MFAVSRSKKLRTCQSKGTIKVHNLLSLAVIFGCGQRRSGTLGVDSINQLDIKRRDTTPAYCLWRSLTNQHCRNDTEEAPVGADTVAAPKFKATIPNPLPSNSASRSGIPRFLYPQGSPAMAESSGPSACCDAVSRSSREPRRKWRRREQGKELAGNLGKLVDEPVVWCHVDDGDRIGGSVSHSCAVYEERAQLEVHA
jgi:hypothetical protein